MRLRATAVAAAAVGILAASAAPALGRPPTVIRTGGPSAPGESKVAIVATNRDLRGHPYTVRSGGSVVLSGHLSTTRGAKAPWRHAFYADLSAVRAPGRYVVRAAGQRSRPWIVKSTGSQSLINLVLNFFRSNRDGAEPSDEGAQP